MMKNRILAALLCGVLLLSAMTIRCAAAYPNGADRMAGTSDQTFSPERNATCEDVLTFAVQVFCQYRGEDMPSPEGEEPVFAPVLRFARENGLLPAPVTDYGAEATRDWAVAALYRALPDREYPARAHYTAARDVFPTSVYYKEIMRFYNAGILSDADGSGAFRPTAPMTGAELADVLYAMACPEARAGAASGAEETDVPHGMLGAGIRLGGVELRGRRLPDTYRAVYGYSCEGRPLYVTRIGGGPNVLFLTYVLHGTEDVGAAGSLWGDGAILNYMAEQTVIPNLIAGYADSAKWTVYVAACCNPDGLARGYRIAKAGQDGKYKSTASELVSISRRTEARFTGEARDELDRTSIYSGITRGDGAGVGGIDLNRSFPGLTGRVPWIVTNVCYNGGMANAAPESLALQRLAETIVRIHQGYKYMIDTHGWYTQCKTGTGEGTIRNAFMGSFHCSFPAYPTLGMNTGYLSQWCCANGFHDACLFEMPAIIYFKDMVQAARLFDFEATDEASTDWKNPVYRFASGDDTLLDRMDTYTVNGVTGAQNIYWNAIEQILESDLPFRK